jgi:hypothetical protein
MPSSIKQKINKELEKIKKGVEKMMNPKREPVPQVVLQPYRNKKQLF